MIAFRAPTEMADKLEAAQELTGKDRTFLILEVLREGLGPVVSRLAPLHETERQRKLEMFQHVMTAPESKRHEVAFRKPPKVRTARKS